MRCRQPGKPWLSLKWNNSHNSMAYEANCRFLYESLPTLKMQVQQFADLSHEKSRLSHGNLAEKSARMTHLNRSAVLASHDPESATTHWLHMRRNRGLTWSGMLASHAPECWRLMSRNLHLFVNQALDYRASCAACTGQVCQAIWPLVGEHDDALRLCVPGNAWSFLAAVCWFESVVACW